MVQRSTWSPPERRSSAARKSGPAREIEGAARLLRGEPPRLGLPRGLGQGREVDHRQGERGQGDDLAQLAVHLGEGRPQRLVAPHDLGEAPLEGGRVEGPPEAHRRGDVVGGAAGRRSGRGARAAAARTTAGARRPRGLAGERRRRGPGRARAGRLDPRGEARPPSGPRRARAAAARRRASRAPGRTRASPGASARRARRSRRGRRRDRAPAPRPRSRRAPPRPACAARRRRSARRRAGRSGAGSAPRSILPVGRQRQRRERDERRRHHVLGQLRREVSAQRARRRRLAFRAPRRPRGACRPGVSSRATTTACRTAGCSASAASISPSSMR